MKKCSIILSILLTTGFVNAEKPDLTSGIQKTKELATKFGAKIDDLKKKIGSVLGKLAPEQETELTKALERLDLKSQARFLKVFKELSPEHQNDMTKAVLNAIFPEEAIEDFEVLVESKKHRYKKYVPTTPKSKA